MPYNYETNIAPRNWYADIIAGENLTYTVTTPTVTTTASTPDNYNVDWITNYEKQSQAYYNIDALIDKICKVICEHVKLDITEDELIKLIKEPN